MRRSSLLTIASPRVVPFIVFGLLASQLFASVGFAQRFPTTVQLPTFGVSIDADGTLERIAKEDPTGALTAARAAAAKRDLPGDVAKQSPLRMISLRRLDAALAAREAAGEELADDALHLAGLQSIRYVFVLAPEVGEPGDVLIAGPAEGWYEDLAGRAVGLSTRAPALRLDDLATALAAYPKKEPGAPFVGCTIDPRSEGLAKFAAFQRTIPHVIPQAQRAAAADAIQRGIAESLGPADIRVFGVAPQSHLARTLVEADYRMKAIGVALEPPPVAMPTYASSIGGPEPGLVRWWFEPTYERLRTNEAKDALEAIGVGLILSSEEKQISSDGRLVSSPVEPGPSSTRYAEAFTAKYDDIAAASPIYAELRNAVDLLTVAAFLARTDAYARSELEPSAILRAGETLAEGNVAPKQVPCVATAFWKGARLIAPAGGGVAIEPLRSLENENLAPFPDADAVRSDVIATIPAGDAWWWDAKR